MSVLLAALLIAGQLHVDYYGFKRVQADRQAVLVGKITGGKQTKKELSITFVVTKVYGPAKIEVGAPATRDIYTGVVSDDPHKSPLDFRLRGAVEAVPAVGTLVAVVPGHAGLAEFALLTEEVERVLDIVYAADPSARMRDEADARLEADLGEPDLADLAKAELRRRGKLTAVMLVKGDMQLAYAHFHALDAAGKQAFVKELLPATKGDRALRLRAARTVEQEATPALAELAAQLDWADEEERRALEDLRIPLHSAKIALGPFADYLVQSAMRRPDYRVSDEMLEQLIMRCDAKTKGQLAIRLLAGVWTSTQARRGDFDPFLLDVGTTLGVQAPTVELVAAIKVLDPQKVQTTSHKQMLLRSAVALGVALVKKDASQKSAARDAIEPFFDSSLTLEPPLVKAYAQTIGAFPKGAPKAVTLELAPGEMRRLSSGERVSFRKGTPDFVIAVDQPDGSGTEQMLQPHTDWYREWWQDPYVLIVKQTSRGVSLRFIPASKDPCMEPADAYELAKAICDKAGFTELITQEPNEADGVFLYDAKGCKIVVGMRTRKVIQRVGRPGGARGETRKSVE